MHRHDHDVVGLRGAPHESSGAGDVEEGLRPSVRSGSDHGDACGAHGQPGDLVRAPGPAKAGTRKRADRHRLAHIAEVGGVVVRQVQQHEADRSQAPREALRRNEPEARVGGLRAMGRGAELGSERFVGQNRLEIAQHEVGLQRATDTAEQCRDSARWIAPVTPERDVARRRHREGGQRGACRRRRHERKYEHEQCQESGAGTHGCGG